MLIPVGGYYTIDAKQAKSLVEQVKPRIVVPMHYRGEGFGYDVLGTVKTIRICVRRRSMGTVKF